MSKPSKSQLPAPRKAAQMPTTPPALDQRQAGNSFPWERKFNFNLNVDVQVKPHLILSASGALLVALHYAGVI